MKKYENIQSQNINQGNKIFLFSSKRCKDCAALDFYIDEIISENQSWEFVYIDIDKNFEIAQEYNIFGIPSFVAISDGKYISDLISKDFKPKSLINSWIKTLKVIKCTRE